ncbi:peptidylprolyl isomerase [Hoyosella rhizosphaerae]|uniref:Peptidyl-prolyl cis-trans isomerase n=1 Tax=Hoyosella rhizosphaerae TaxID=1755582 RepID=A0A916U5E6_9ACTN|nr:peptidylprolyl isomerase [Hoyosella rhizosphaerae]MBN4926427.1 peptidylprolyl isomerase [Hoyosella rhizosphaerae]GGC59433.1 peptidyl-prolyl cis-trans isomerase [Hoyosella rhizosphaerae]
MPSNQQRREVAKNKLEQQLKARAKQDRRRNILTIVGAVVAALVVAAAAVGVYKLTAGSQNNDSTQASNDTNDESFDEIFDSQFEEPDFAALPESRSEPLPPTVDCEYFDSRMPGVRDVDRPQGENVPTEGTVAVTIDMSEGPVELTLDRAKSPCTVNSFVSLAEQGYFNDTECHRLVTGGIFVLQCGDPSATGTGGPGYEFHDEFPHDQFDSPRSEMTIYPRGTVAMANAGESTNGSQFFLVYDDSPLPPLYNVFGEISDDGLNVIDAIAEGGAPGNEGVPNIPADIKTITVGG